MALDPNEAPPGCVAVEDEEIFIGCSRCCFSDGHQIDVMCRRYDDLTVQCSASTREDGCYVSFAHHDGIATAIWPYDSEGTPVETSHA